jgi:hypothetical protein
MARYKSLIGRFEPIGFPGLLLDEVPAKVDTGASISSIHAENIKEIKKNGKVNLKFTLLGSHYSYDYSREVVVDNFSIRVIENSFGHSEKRYLVTLKVKVAKKIFNAHFTLADRSKKSFPILLGRELLNGRYIIDTSICNINRKLLESRMPKVLKEDNDEE